MFNPAVRSLVGAALVFGSIQAYAQSQSTLRLGSDSKTIQSRAHSIESDYVKDLKDSNVSTTSIMDTPVGYSQPGDTYDAQAEYPEDHAPAIEMPAATTPQYAPRYENTNTFKYGSTLKMREELKIGAGVAMGGTLGVAGFNLELNFEDADGVLAGFGTGPGYNSVQVAWKHAFDGDYLAPYTTVGYSRWYNSRGRSNSFLDSDVLNRVLTANEKADRTFGTDFVNGSLGIQYNQLSGDFAGVSIFGELTAMYEVKRAMLIPNGSVGAVYYF